MTNGEQGRVTLAVISQASDLGLGFFIYSTLLQRVVMGTRHIANGQ